MCAERKRRTGKTSLQIKFLVYERWGSITAAARDRDLSCSRSQLSYCISRRRVSRELRVKLARALGMTVEELFGKPESDEERECDAEETSEQEESSGGKEDE